MGKKGNSGATMPRVKTCAELMEDDGPKLVAKVVGTALNLSPAVMSTGLPKDILEAAKLQLPEVDVAGLAPKAALLVIGRAIVARGPS